ncbi:MAG: hypothetical protein MJB14_04715, partial [Spirochaetes bacterium]|nr:hypothetical protein [Spirochaetota bacterium]
MSSRNDGRKIILLLLLLIIVLIGGVLIVDRIGKLTGFYLPIPGIDIIRNLSFRQKQIDAAED